MNRRQRMGTVMAATVVAVGGLASVAAAGNDDGENTASGPEADRASRAALEITGGGTANAVERDSEAGATWEVEVTRTDGTTVDVRLDENLALVVVEVDSESD